MPEVQPFVLNDETVVNSHGFRVRNSGLSLERLRINPVILAQHANNVWSVIGRWVNFRFEGSKLLADAEFDTEDPDAAKIAGKVARGFLKGASLGLSPMGETPWEVMPDGIPDLAASEALEASIVAIPSNRSAVRLYADDSKKKELSTDEIKLSIPSVNFLNPNMNKLTLSVQTLLVLGLESADNLADVAKGVEALAVKFNDKLKELTTANDKITELQSKVTNFEQAKAIELVDGAINAKKLGADQREAFLKLAATDFDSAKNLINSMAPRTDLGAEVKNPVKVGEVKTADDFQKLSLEEQLSFKENNPEEYKKLFS